jgi:hypothetical protein
MQAGLLWFDNDPARSLDSKATDAAERFTQKFGVAPNVCYVNVRALSGGDKVIPFHEGQLRLSPANNILVNHFWIGYGDT